MRSTTVIRARVGKVSYAAGAWLLGLPLPVVIIALLWGGCLKW